MTAAATSRPAPDLAAVLALAARGWRLLPCTPRGKEPLITSWPSAATTDPHTIQRWAERYPQCNWALVTGPASGLWIFDQDGEPGAAAIRELCRDHGDDGWLLTLTCITARGVHYYFCWPEGANIRNSAGKIGRGLDVRGDRGFVIVPPSVHPTGAVYYWKDAGADIKPAPGWLLEKVTTPAQRSPIAAADIGILPEGRRNDGLTRLAGALRRRGASQSEIDIALSEANERRCRPPLPDAEVRAIAESVSRYPSGGPDPLLAAWQASEGQYPSKRERFLALARQLQASRPGLPIALPLERIGSLMGCDWSLVRRWRRRAVDEGQLRPSERYVPHRRASQYSFVECPTRDTRDVPLGGKCPTTEPTSGLVGHPEKSPSGTPPKAEPEKSDDYMRFEL